MPSAMPISAVSTKGPEELSADVAEDSSRIFVKNLPPNITEESLRKHFSLGGRHITDVKLMTRRRIAFLGYRSAEEAKTAVRYFHRSYIRMSKLYVEVAKPIGDLSLPVANNFKRPYETQEAVAEDPQNAAQEDQLSKRRKLDEAADPKLREFLQVMKPQHGRGISSTADVFAAIGDSQTAQPDTGAAADAAAAAALAAAEGESDDEYDALPAKQAKKAKAAIDDETTAAQTEANAKEATKVVISATAIDEVVRNATDSPSVGASAPPQQQDAQQREQQQQKQANASATDDEWLRSRTNRLLDLLDPSELAPPTTSAAPPAPIVAKTQASLRTDAKRDEVQDEIDEIDEQHVDSATPIDNKVVNEVEVAPVPQGPVLPEDQIRETSRLFIRNLPYDATEAHIWKYFEAFGKVKEVNLPVTNAGPNKGFAMVLFSDPSAALAAFRNADGKTFQGRILHVLPAKAKKSAADVAMNEFAISQMPLKKQKLLRKKAEAATSTFSWNALFMSQDAVNAAVAERLGVSKSEILDPTSSGEAVRQAVRQTSIIEETKSYFTANGVDLDLFKPHTKRGDRCILVKNFAYGTSSREIRSMFEEFGPVVRVLMPTGGTIAIVQFAQAAHGRLAYSRLAYRRVNDTVLMLEKCPENLFGDDTKDRLLQDAAASANDKKDKTKRPKVTASELLGEAQAAEEVDETADTDATTSSLFVRNLNFTTTTQQLATAFSSLAGFVSARVNSKPNPKKPGETLSMGYGFVEFRSRATATAASKAMEGSILHGHTLTVQTAHRGQQDAAAERRESDRKRKQAANEGSKLIIKNLPFEATPKDVRTLLSTYGQVKAVRLPRKVGSGTRGYAFAEFVTPSEAANAMDALRDTHLLGRRLVLQYAEAEALDPEEELAKMRKKVGSQMNTVALQQLTTARRQRTKVHIGEEGADEGM